MKTKKGIVVYNLGDGGVSIECEWHRNVIISGKDLGEYPELLVNAIRNLKKIRDLNADIFQE